MTTIYIPHCWICGRVVASGNSQVDDNGLATHESCYVLKVALERAQSPANLPVVTAALNKGQSRALPSAASEQTA